MHCKWQAGAWHTFWKVGNILCRKNIRGQEFLASPWFMIQDIKISLFGTATFWHSWYFLWKEKKHFLRAKESSEGRKYHFWTDSWFRTKISLFGASWWWEGINCSLQQKPSPKSSTSHILSIKGEGIVNLFSSSIGPVGHNI